MQIPAAVRSQDVLGIRNQGALVRPHTPDEWQQPVERIAFDVELRPGKFPHDLAQLPDVLRTDMPLIGTRMDRNPVRPRGQCNTCHLPDIRNADRARVAKERHFVQIYAERGHGRSSAQGQSSSKSLNTRRLLKGRYSSRRLIKARMSNFASARVLGSL